MNWSVKELYSAVGSYGQATKSTIQVRNVIINYLSVLIARSDLFVLTTLRQIFQEMCIKKIGLNCLIRQHTHNNDNFSTEDC